MNFIENETNFKKLLVSGTRKTKRGETKDTYYRGMYIFSRDLDDVRFKVGLAWGQGGLFERLKKQYRICYPFPKEFYIHFMVLSLTPEHARKVEKLMLSKLKTIASINNSSKANREWKIVNKREDLKLKLREMLNENRNLWFALIVFNTVVIKVLDNTQALSTSDMNKPSNTRIQNRVKALK